MGDKRTKTTPYLLNPMDVPMQRKCDALMKNILKRNQAVHFSKPVEWKKMGLHDYPRLIKQPMDLSTVADQLTREKYARLEDFVNDVRLCWKNAFICNMPLNDMKSNPLAEWFRDPVDHVNLGLTDYLQVISQPMDLSTIQKRLERSHYMSTEDFAHDVRLVWQNGITYNSANSMFGVVAGILAQIFERRFALLTRSAQLDPGRPIPDRPGWPTFQQKKKFYDLCTKLTLADLNQMVGLVQRSCQPAVSQCGHKEVEVDVDELDMETFHKVNQWVSSKAKVKTEG